MAGLSIASHDLEVTSFTETAPINVGEASRAFAGGARSSVRTQKRTFQATTAPYSKTTYDAIVGHVANDTPVSVSGSCLVGATLTCLVRVTYDLVGIGTADAGYNFLYVMSLAIEEA